MVDDEGPSRISRSFSARLRRKEQVAAGEDVPETLEEEQAAANAPAPDSTAESEEDAALDDDQLLQKYGLPNPEEIEDEASLDAFMQNGLPDRLRQMALRRMWRLNPLFRFADEMVEYGEDYTDAATVIDGMTTAYQVGKGYLQKAFDALDDEGGDTEADGLSLSSNGPATQSLQGRSLRMSRKKISAKFPKAIPRSRAVMLAKIQLQPQRLCPRNLLYPKTFCRPLRWYRTSQRLKSSHSRDQNA